MTKKRTTVELLLMELIYQAVRNEHSSADGEKDACRRAGFTEEEIKARFDY